MGDHSKLVNLMFDPLLMVIINISNLEQNLFSCLLARSLLDISFLENRRWSWLGRLSIMSEHRMSDRVDVRPLYYWLVAPDVLSQKQLLYKIYWGDEIFSIIDVSIRLCWYLPRKRAAVKRLETGFNSHAIKLLRSDPRKPGGLVFSALNPSWTFYIYISSSGVGPRKVNSNNLLLAIMGYFMMGYLNRMLCTLIMYPNYAIPRRKPSGLTEQREWR